MKRFTHKGLCDVMLAVKKQERLLRAKLQLQQGEDDDREEDEEEGEEDEDVRWGAKKRAYYDAEEEVRPRRLHSYCHSCPHDHVHLLEGCTWSRIHCHTEWKNEAYSEEVQSSCQDRISWKGGEIPASAEMLYQCDSWMTRMR